MSRMLVLAMTGCALLAACGKPADTAPGTGVTSTVTYRCDPDMSLRVEYDNAAGADGQAILTLDGRIFTLDHAISGSGVRYGTAAGRTPGSTLIWWNKGRGGTIIEGSTANPDAPETTIATCTETAG